MSAALLLTALFNGAWQGTLMCAAAYVAFRYARRLNATTMFAVWSALLGICLALPIANYAFAVHPYTQHIAAPAPVRTENTTPDRGAYTAVAETQLPAPKMFAFAPPKAASISQSSLNLMTRILENAGLVIALLGLIALVRLVFLCRDIVAMMAARRAAKRIDLPIRLSDSIRRSHAFASSSTLTSPCVLGFVPALIVIPEDLLDAPRSELLSVVLHEGEHVRRYDDVQNVLHRIIGAIAFFAPGVRIALRELAQYREQICDDAAVNQIGDPIVYAKTLTGMAQWAQGRGVPVPSLIFKRKQLLHRLEVLLDGAVNHSLRMNRRFAVGAVAAILMAAIVVLRLQLPVIAQTVDAPRSPVAPSSPAPVMHGIKSVHIHGVAPKAPVLAVPAKHAPAKPAKVAKPAKIAKPAKVVKHAEPAQPAKRPKTATIIAPALDVHGPVQGVWPSVPAVTRLMKMKLSSRVYMHRFTALAPAAFIAGVTPRHSGTDLLDALQAAGMRNLSVDQLIALRDHGVSPPLISAAQGYFGGALSPDGLIKLADHGVGPLYLASLASAGLSGIGYEDVIRLRDNGVDASFIQKIRKFNPRAGVDDIIRLHDAGF